MTAMTRDDGDVGDLLSSQTFAKSRKADSILFTIPKRWQT